MENLTRFLREHLNKERQELDKEPFTDKEFIYTLLSMRLREAAEEAARQHYAQST